MAGSPGPAVQRKRTSAGPLVSGLNSARRAFPPFGGWTSNGFETRITSLPVWLLVMARNHKVKLRFRGCGSLNTTTVAGEVISHSSKPPIWLERALQGLAFWIGHRHSMFNGYPLSEGALVAEMCNLISANLPSQFVLMPECFFKNLVSGNKSLQGMADRARADLVLCDATAKTIGRDGNISSHTKYVIEVKRNTAARQFIDDDLYRLHSLLMAKSDATRCFAVIVSESKSPRRFVKDGKARLGNYPIPSCSGTYRVRRVVKAATSFEGKESAHYVCMLEVLL